MYGQPVTTANASTSSTNTTTTSTSTKTNLTHLEAVGPVLVVLLDAQQLEDAPLQGLRRLGVRHEGVVACAGLADRLTRGPGRRPLRLVELATTEKQMTKRNKNDAIFFF